MSINPDEPRMPMPASEASAAQADGAAENAAPQANEISLSTLPAARALDLMIKDPVGFVQQIVASTTEKHLADLKEQAELRGALNAFRKAHPEAARFEPFILQEVISLIQNDPDGVIDPWDKLLAKGLENFRQKFTATVNEEFAKGETAGTENMPQAPFVEGAANRIMPEAPPSFTRAQIAAMSRSDFLKNEAAINEALKNNRIK